MANAFILKLLVVLIITLCTLMLQGLSAIYAQTKDWKVLSLMLIPLAFDAVYVWIGVLDPSIEASRNVLRMTVVFSSCIALHVIYTHLIALNKVMLKNEESVRNKKDATS